MDMHTKAKKTVLEELISMMEERELGELKGKSPKFAKIDIQSDDPEIMEKIKDKLIPNESEIEKEEKTFSTEEPEVDGSENEEDLERLKELYSKLK